MEPPQCAHWRNGVRCTRSGVMHMWAVSLANKKYVQVPMCRSCFEDYPSDRLGFYLGSHVLQPACLDNTARWITAHPRSWCERPGETTTAEDLLHAIDFGPNGFTEGAGV